MCIDTDSTSRRSNGTWNYRVLPCSPHHQNAIPNRDQYSRYAWVCGHSPIELLNGGGGLIRRRLFQHLAAPEHIID